MSIKAKVDALKHIDAARAALLQLRDSERMITASLPHLQLAPAGYGCALDVCVSVQGRRDEPPRIGGIHFSGRGGDLFTLTANEAHLLGEWLVATAHELAEAAA